MTTADDLYDEGWAGTTTTDLVLNLIGGILGAVITLTGALTVARWHLNRTSKEHRP